MGRRWITVCSLSLVFVILLFSFNKIDGQGEPLAQIQEKLAKISAGEREILQNLFRLTQEIEAMEREEEMILQEMEELNREIQMLEEEIQREEERFQKRRTDLREVLRSYQRRGAGSYIQILLTSDNLTTLLGRVNILRDLTRNTGELLEELEKSQEKRNREQERLAEKLRYLEGKEENHRQALAKKLESKEELENYLASMEGERTYYEAYLESIQQIWQEVKGVVQEATEVFYRILNEGEVPSDALKITLSLSGIKGSIDEGTLNAILREEEDLPEMEFRFKPGKVEMILLQYDLVLTGVFVIIDENILKFEVEAGSFYGMKLEESALEEMFKEGDMVLHLKPLLGNSKIHSIEIRNRFIELSIRLGL